MKITEETRRESYKQVDKVTLSKHIIGVLEGGAELTAREIAVKLYSKKLITFPTRQAVAPRLTEMEIDGIVEAVSKKRDIGTGRNVAVYRLVKE